MFNGFLKFSILALIGAIILPITSSAQSINLPNAFLNELAIEITPTYPKPNELVLVDLSLNTGDLNTANISWYQDNKLVLDGIGEKRYSFTTGPVGKETTIEIIIKLSDGVSFSKSFTVNPTSVDLVWEANSYVPPFYKGKALHPTQGSLKVVAIPEIIKNGKKANPQNLVYKWSNGINVYQNQNGYGKNYIIFSGSLIGIEEKISVLVTDPISGLSTHGYINIYPTDPEIVFYENSPYYGHIFDSAIASSFNLKTGEVQILATPYYFTKETRDLLKYEWKLNNQLIPSLSGSRTAIFKKPENQKGQSVISLQIENTNRILQQASNNLIMNFSD